MVWEPAKVENADKVKLSKRINTLENQLNDSNVEMYSYVISVTDEQTLNDRFDDFSVENYEDNNVYLQTKGYLKKILQNAGVSLK